ncbi:MAG: hypothetical protein V4543_03540 [Bacteroidota bacterium]
MFEFATAANTLHKSVNPGVEFGVMHTFSAPAPCLIQKYTTFVPAFDFYKHGQGLPRLQFMYFAKKKTP